jgi:hypothetical protein
MTMTIFPALIASNACSIDEKDGMMPSLYQKMEKIGDAMGRWEPYSGNGRGAPMPPVWLASPKTQRLTWQRETHWQLVAVIYHAGRLRPYCFVIATLGVKTPLRK